MHKFLEPLNETMKVRLEHLVHFKGHHKLILIKNFSYVETQKLPWSPKTCVYLYIRNDIFKFLIQYKISYKWNEVDGYVIRLTSEQKLYWDLMQ